MAAEYQVWLSTDQGTRLALLDNVLSFAYVERISSIGVVSVRLPGSFDWSLLNIDNRLEIWRRPEGGTKYLASVGFIRHRRRGTDGDGLRWIEVSGPDQNDLLVRRIVAYAAGTSEAEKTDNADDMMKEVVSENLGDDATDTDRDVTDYGFSIAADVSAGPSVEKAFSWRQVEGVLEDIAAASAEAGDEVLFHVVPKTATDFEFQTWAGQRQDCTWPDGNPVLVFSMERGNLAEPMLDEDYWDEVNYVYAGGQGEGENREIVEVEDTTRIGTSVWNRREAFQDCRNLETTAAITDRAEELLTEGLPIRRFSGRLLSVGNTVYGRDWHLGYKVTAEYEGQLYDGVVRSVRVEVDTDGAESVTAEMEVVA